MMVALTIPNEDQYRNLNEEAVSDNGRLSRGSRVLVLVNQQAGATPSRASVLESLTILDAAVTAIVNPHKPLTIDDLGWTREQAAAIRGIFGSIADDWDDPIMDVYDAL